MKLHKLLTHSLNNHIKIVKACAMKIYIKTIKDFDCSPLHTFSKAGFTVISLCVLSGAMLNLSAQ